MFGGGVDAIHRQVAEAIAAGTPGHAQAEVDGLRVSYRRRAGPFGLFGGMTHAPFPGPRPRTAAQLMPKLLLAVARGEGAASPQTFKAAILRHRIADLRRFPAHRAEEHAEADALEGYFIDGPGRAALR